MKRTSLTSFFLVLVAASVWAQAKPNFSGTWQLDIAKSETGAREVERLIDRLEQGIFS